MRIGSEVGSGKWEVRKSERSEIRNPEFALCQVWSLKFEVWSLKSEVWSWKSELRSWKTLLGFRTYMINTCILGRTYFVERSIHLIEEHWLLIITGVQASGVIIDRLLRQCCFVWSEIVGPHSSGNFNDWPLKLKAGSKYRDALRDSI